MLKLKKKQNSKKKISITCFHIQGHVFWIDNILSITIHTSSITVDLLTTIITCSPGWGCCRPTIRIVNGAHPSIGDAYRFICTAPFYEPTMRSVHFLYITVGMTVVNIIRR